MEGEIVAEGGSVGAGYLQELKVTIKSSLLGEERVSHYLKAGGYYSLGFDFQGITDTLITEREEKFMKALDEASGEEDWPDLYIDDVLGEHLNLTAITYFNNMEKEAEELSALSQWFYGGIITEALAARNIAVEYVYGLPYTYSPLRYSIDVKLGIISCYPMDGDMSRTPEFMKLLGENGSFLEHAIWEDMAHIPAISAVKAIQLANESGITVLTLRATGELNQLNVSEDIKEYIRDDINSGCVVTVPQSEIYYQDWYGSGWIALDEKTGAGGYKICRYLDGGMTTFGKEKEECVKNLKKEVKNYVLNYVTLNWWDKLLVWYYITTGNWGELLETLIDITVDSNVLAVAEILVNAGVVSLVMLWEHYAINLGEGGLYEKEIMHYCLYGTFLYQSLPNSYIIEQDINWYTKNQLNSK